MKKILLFLTITFMVSCKQETTVAEQPPKYINWQVEVKYLDKTTDTIVVNSITPPYLYVNNNVSTLTLGDSYMPAASYVKSIKILNQQ